MENNDDTLDMGAMCEALEIADRLDRVAACLKRLGSNPARVVEPPTLDVLKQLRAGSYSETPYALWESTECRPVLLDLEGLPDELRYCAMQLENLTKRLWGLGEDGAPGIDFKR